MTFNSMVSFFAQFAICTAVTGALSSISVSKTISAGTGTFDGLSPSCSLLRASAFVCLVGWSKLETINIVR